MVTEPRWKWVADTAEVVRMMAELWQRLLTEAEGRLTSLKFCFAWRTLRAYPANPWR